MKPIRNTTVLRSLCGFAIIFAIFGAWANLWANQTSIWIQALLQPEQGVYSFSLSGNKLNLLIEPLKEPKLAAKKPVQIYLKETNQLNITADKPVRGVVLDSELMRSSEVFFIKGWTVRFTEVEKIEAFITSNEEVDLNKTKESETGYKLPPSKEFTVEIHAKRIKAELLLPPNSSPQNNNPIKLKQKRAPAGSLIEYRLRADAVTGGKSKITVLFLSEEAPETRTLKVVSMDVEPKKNVQGLWGTVALPGPEDFGHKWWIKSKPVKAIVLVTDEDGNFFLKIDDTVVTGRGLGVIGGVVVVIVFLIIIRLVKAVPFSQKWNKNRYKEWEKLKPIERFFRSPFHFAVTPLGRYSISLAQILFWTLIVIFALVYVAISRGEFLAITGQILILLGISGTTAVASKVAATTRFYDIPDEYMKDITENRLPRPRDLFSIDNVPNIFKFQIFAFTLLAGLYVIRELLRSGNFPTLDQNLLTLMGISGGVYIANELATKNVWEKLHKLIEEINDKKKELPKLNKELAELDAEHTELNKQLVELREALAKRSGPIPPDDPDKKREGELKKHVEEIKKKTSPRDELDKEVKTLKEQVKDLLKDIYTESTEDSANQTTEEES